MLYFKAMPNLIDFYKEIFLHVIPVCITVPWSNTTEHFINTKWSLLFCIKNILNKPSLPAENSDQLFSITLLGTPAYPAQPTFHFNNKQVKLSL